MTPMGNKVLVPLIDMCNHSPEGEDNCEPRGKIEEVEAGMSACVGIEMIAKKDIKRGEAITTCYGTLDAVEWF